MRIDWANLAETLLAVFVYGLGGLAMFGVCFALLTAVLPFSIRKELEEDQNVALALVISAAILGMSWIIAAAVG